MDAPQHNIQNSFGPEVITYHDAPEPAQQPVVNEKESYSASPLMGQQKDNNGLGASNQTPSQYHAYMPVAEDQIAAGHTAPDAAPPRKKILGLPVPIFWVAVGDTILKVLVIAIGAGLGVGLSKDDGPSESSSPTAQSATASGATSTGQSTATSGATKTSASTSTSTSSAPVTSGTTGLAANSCDFNDVREYSADGGAVFKMHCYTEWAKDSEASDGEDEVDNLDEKTVYTFEDCMGACVTYNKSHQDDEDLCRAVTYNSNLTASIDSKDANCFLKQISGKSNGGAADTLASAELTTDPDGEA